MSEILIPETSAGIDAVCSGPDRTGVQQQCNRASVVDLSACAMSLIGIFDAMNAAQH